MAQLLVTSDRRRPCLCLSYTRALYLGWKARAKELACTSHPFLNSPDTSGEAAHCKIIRYPPWDPQKCRKGSLSTMGVAQSGKGYGKMSGWKRNRSQVTHDIFSRIWGAWSGILRLADSQQSVQSANQLEEAIRMWRFPRRVAHMYMEDVEGIIFAFKELVFLSYVSDWIIFKKSWTID